MCPCFTLICSHQESVCAYCNHVSAYITSSYEMLLEQVVIAYLWLLQGAFFFCFVPYSLLFQSSSLLYSPIALLLPSPPLSLSVLQMTFTDSALRYCIWSTASTCICKRMQTPTAFHRRAWADAWECLLTSLSRISQMFLVLCVACYSRFLLQSLYSIIWCTKTKKNLTGWNSWRLSSSQNSCRHTTERKNVNVVLHDWNPVKAPLLTSLLSSTAWAGMSGYTLCS